MWIVHALASLKLNVDLVEALSNPNDSNRKLCMTATSKICKGLPCLTAEKINSRLLQHGMAAQKLHLVSTCPHPLNSEMLT